VPERVGDGRALARRVVAGRGDVGRLIGLGPISAPISARLINVINGAWPLFPRRTLLKSHWPGKRGAGQKVHVP
jgi:hypothetical protein